MSYKRDCASCGAPRWMVEVATGRWHPFDCEDESEALRPLDGMTMEEYFANDYTSHFDTCPDAEKWRERKKDQGKLF